MQNITNIEQWDSDLIVLLDDQDFQYEVKNVQAFENALMYLFLEGNLTDDEFNTLDASCDEMGFYRTNLRHDDIIIQGINELDPNTFENYAKCTNPERIPEDKQPTDA
jgi:hypothetical protein